MEQENRRFGTAVIEAKYRMSRAGVRKGLTKALGPRIDRERLTPSYAVHTSQVARLYSRPARGAGKQQRPGRMCDETFPYVREYALLRRPNPTICVLVPPWDWFGLTRLSYIVTVMAARRDSLSTSARLTS